MERRDVAGHRGSGESAYKFHSEGAQVLLLSGDTAIPDSCTAANDVRRIAVILLDVHFEPGQFYWCLGAY